MPQGERRCSEREKVNGTKRARESEKQLTDSESEHWQQKTSQPVRGSRINSETRTTDRRETDRRIDRQSDSESHGLFRDVNETLDGEFHLLFIILLTVLLCAHGADVVPGEFPCE